MAIRHKVVTGDGVFADMDNWGVVDGGYRLTGDASYIEWVDNADLDYGTIQDFTLIIDVIPDDVTRTTDYVINKETGGIGYGLYLNQDDLYLRFDDNSTDVSGIIATSIFEDDVKSRIGITFNRDGSATAYHNGLAVGSIVISSVVNTISNAGVLRVGTESGGTTNEFAGIVSNFRVFNRVLTPSEMLAEYSNGFPSGSGIDINDKWGTETTQTSGVLVIGQRYILFTFVAGDDFTNIGAASNTTGIEFIATGTTPTTWTNSSTIKPIGCVLDCPQENALDTQWRDNSDNTLHGTVNGALNLTDPVDIRHDGTIAMTANLDLGTNKIVNVVDPTLDQDAATKLYVDIAVGFTFDYFFGDTSDVISGIYYVMTDDDLGGVISNLDTSIGSSGDDKPLKNFLTIDGEPGVQQLESGIYEAHIHAQKVSGGSAVDGIYWELYKRASVGTGGAETLLGTSEISGAVTTEAGYNIHLVLSSPVTILNTDRLLVKFYANLGAGGGAIVRLRQEGTTAAHCEFQTTSNILSNIFVRQDGTEELSADWDAGSFKITAEQFESDIATGDAPFIVASVTEVTNLRSATTTALANARTIGGVSFDATANITVATATGGFGVSGGDLTSGTYIETTDAIATAQTVGVSVINTTAAAAGVQQYSPVLELEGQGWKTDATAETQEVKWGFQTRPVQGTANPTGILDILSSINGSAYSAKATLTSAGVLTATTFVGAVTGTASGNATLALDNLASVQINESLVSDADITDDLGTGDVRWRDAWFETLSSGLTATDTLKLRGRDVDGAAYIDILTITSANDVTADLNTITTIGGNVILDVTSTVSALTTVGTITNGTWEGTTIAVNQGGTGQTTYINGQLLIGNTTGNTLTKAILTAGTGITINNGTGTIEIVTDDANIDHNSLNNLATGDPHTLYVLLAGRATGQTIIGGTASGDDLILQSSSHGTKGNIFFGASNVHYDETTDSFNIGGGTTITPPGFFNIDKATTNADVYLTTYSDGTDTSEIWLRKSNSNTLGTLTPTATSEALGNINFIGVTSGSAFDTGAQIYAVQNGAAGTTVPCDLIFRTWTNSAANTNQLVLNTNGNVGVKVADPDTDLEVMGSTGVKISFDATENTTLVTDTNGYMTITPSGKRIGIGIVPTAHLDIDYSGSHTNLPVLHVIGGGAADGVIHAVKTTDGNTGDIAFNYENQEPITAASEAFTTRIEHTYSASGDSNILELGSRRASGKYIRGYRTAASTVDLFYIKNSGASYFAGDMGIGVADPDVNLEVMGSTGVKISFDGAKYTTLVTDTNEDFTITPSGNNILLDSGLTVGSTTQAGDNNLRVEGTSALVGDVTVTGELNTVGWTDYGGTSTIVGWSGTPTANIWYKKVGNLVFVNVSISGTSNATNISFTLPFTVKNSAGCLGRIACSARDNGTYQTTPGVIETTNNSANATASLDFSGGGGWTASGGKTITGQFWYEAQ